LHFKLKVHYLIRIISSQKLRVLPVFFSKVFFGAVQIRWV